MTAQAAIFGPFFAMMLLTPAVWIYMYIRRIAFITSLPINSQDLAVPGALARLMPPSVSNPSDNLKTCSKSRSSSMRSRYIFSSPGRSMRSISMRRGSSWRSASHTVRSIAPSTS